MIDVLGSIYDVKSKSRLMTTVCTSDRSRHWVFEKQCSASNETEYVPLEPKICLMEDEPAKLVPSPKDHNNSVFEFVPVEVLVSFIKPSFPNV